MPSRLLEELFGVVRLGRNRRHGRNVGGDQRGAEVALLIVETARRRSHCLLRIPFSLPVRSGLASRLSKVLVKIFGLVKAPGN